MILATVKANICGKRVRKARVAIDMEQLELAVAVEVDHGIKMSRTMICRIETQKRPLKDAELLAIAQVLDVDPAWLLLGED